MVSAPCSNFILHLPDLERLVIVLRCVQYGGRRRRDRVQPVCLPSRLGYGVDKNPMAVELAKVALWLHTFTVGAPLSFIDHHLRAGDSLFGLWVRDSIDKAGAQCGELLHIGPLPEAEALRRQWGSSSGWPVLA